MSKPVDENTVFKGHANDRFITVFGKRYPIPANCLGAEIRVWDLDKNGNLQRNPDGSVKVKVITENIESIEITKPKDA